MKSVYLIAAFLTNVKLLLSLTCPSPYTAVGTSGCYYIPPDEKIDWYNAYAKCKLDFNGYLAEITNEQEEANIVAFIKRADPKIQFFYWIGGSDMQQEGSFRWMTSGNYFTYTAWEAKQPDNSRDNLNNTENCVHFWFLDNAYSWNDYMCAKSTSTSPINAQYLFKGLCEANPLSPCKKPESCQCHAARKSLWTDL